MSSNKLSKLVSIAYLLMIGCFFACGQEPSSGVEKHPSKQPKKKPDHTKKPPQQQDDVQSNAPSEIFSNLFSEPKVAPLLPEELYESKYQELKENIINKKEFTLSFGSHKKTPYKGVKFLKSGPYWDDFLVNDVNQNRLFVVKVLKPGSQSSGSKPIDHKDVPEKVFAKLKFYQKLKDVAPDNSIFAKQKFFKEDFVVLVEEYSSGKTFEEQLKDGDFLAPQQKAMSELLFNISSQQYSNGTKASVFNLANAELKYIKGKYIILNGKFEYEMNISTNKIDDSTNEAFRLHFMSFLLKTPFAIKGAKNLSNYKSIIKKTIQKDTGNHGNIPEKQFKALGHWLWSAIDFNVPEGTGGNRVSQWFNRLLRNRERDKMKKKQQHDMEEEIRRQRSGVVD